MSQTSADHVEAVLAALRDVYGTPSYLRSDNGAEFVALTLQGWLAREGIVPLYIDPGCPWQNGKDERFNGTVRDECLNMQLFGSLIEARIRLEAFRQHYNTQRPHSALGSDTLDVQASLERGAKQTVGFSHSDLTRSRGA